MDFLIVILIVTAAGSWLGLRLYRFVRRTVQPPQPGSPACSGCTDCTPQEPDTSCPIAANFQSISDKLSEIPGSPIARGPEEPRPKPSVTN